MSIACPMHPADVREIVLAVACPLVEQCLHGLGLGGQAPTGRHQPTDLPAA